MASPARHLYEFGPYRLDVAERLLLRDGKPVEVTAKVFDLLVMMVENQGKLLEKSHMLEALWPDSFVEEVNLSVNVSALRKALGEHASAPQYIETVPKRGYRFIGSVTTQTVFEGELIVAAETMMATRTQSAALDTNAMPGSAVVAPKRRPFLRLSFLISAGLVVAIALAIAGYLLFHRGSPHRTALRTIAVLPFKTLTSNDTDQALGLGMADALITRLGNLQQVIVRPTSTVLKYTDAGKDPLAAGRELGVEAVLDGRVQRDDKKIRVTARLLSVEDGSSLWVGKFDDFFTNLFALQDSISEKMAEALSLRLSADEQQLMTRRHTENTEAYQLYVEGRYFYFKYEFDKATGLFESAIRRDPDYSLAYAGLASSYIALGANTLKHREMRDKAMGAVNKALALDPTLDEAYNALGWAKFLGDWDWPGAEAALRRAIELNPNNPDAHINYATLLVNLGRFEEGLRESERALQLDPVSSDVNLNSAYDLALSRRYDQALERTTRMTELDPHHPRLFGLLVQIFVSNSRFAQAIAEVDKTGTPDQAKYYPYLAVAYVGVGRRADAEAILRGLLQNPDRRGSSYSIAVVYNALGDKEHALELLEKAYQSRDNQMIHVKVDPVWDSIRNDPRYTALLQRMGL